MSEGTTDKEARLDKATEWAVLIAAVTVIVWAVVNTALNIWWWCTV